MLTHELFDLMLIRVAFAASGLQIENQVLHVEPQLANRILNELQNLASTIGALTTRWNAGWIVSRCAAGVLRSPFEDPPIR